ncbi:MAG: penicillin-binding protein 2 [Actinomycetales bacterium]|nr:penicillin-binding protein 2 [Actinomycetales bacterium]
MLLIVAFVAVFVIKLVDIQVIKASAYNEESLGKRSIPATIFSQRGTIVDANGVILADSVMRYNVTISPKNAKDFLRVTDRADVTITPQQAAVEIGGVTGQKPEEILKIVADALAANPLSDFAYLAKGVDVDKFRALNALGIPWLYSEPSPGRSYPNGSVAGNLIGYVGEDGVAQAGLELTSDACLAGINGEEIYQRGADGVRIPGSTITSVKAQDGSSLKLTIDSDLQWFTQQVLAKQVDATGAKWGTVVVQEVKTGKLLAVADYPTVDPNNVDGTAEANRGSLAFMAPFEPGSTIKSLTAASLLDAGVADPNSQVFAPYSIEFPNGAKVHDAAMHGVLQLTLTGVLEESSNVGITQLGEALSAEKRYDYLSKFGFGGTTAVGFQAESAGLLHPWQEWDNQTYYNTMFGQGLSTTAIQVASAYQALGNHGVHLPVQLVEGCISPDGTLTPTKLPEPVQVVSDAAATTTVNMLENFVTKGWISKYISIPGYRIAAKTGTAEQSAGDGTYSNNYIVSNAALIPANDPQYVVTVTIAYPQSNGSMASPPVLKAVMAQVLKKYRVEPSPDGAPDLAVRF